MRVIKVWLLIALLAGAILGVLWMTEVIPPGDVGDLAGKIFGAILMLGLAHFAWAALRGRTDLPDSTDKPVP
jgi:hypothetical protein